MIFPLFAFIKPKEFFLGTIHMIGNSYIFLLLFLKIDCFSVLLLEFLLLLLNIEWRRLFSPIILNYYSFKVIFFSRECFYKFLSLSINRLEILLSSLKFQRSLQLSKSSFISIKFSSLKLMGEMVYLFPQDISLQNVFFFILITLDLLNCFDLKLFTGDGVFELGKVTNFMSPSFKKPPIFYILAFFISKKYKALIARSSSSEFPVLMIVLYIFLYGD